MEARGFTLLEVLVVLGIIAVLSGIAVWSARAWAPDLQLNSAARQVVLDLRLARSRAITDHQNHRLVFAPATDSYRRQHRVGGVYEDEGANVSLPWGVDLVDCSALGKAITFAPRGTASTFGT